MNRSPRPALSRSPASRARWVPGALVAAALVLAPRPARAMVCSFTTVVGVAFGNYNVYSASHVDTTGSLTYVCNTGIASFVTIDLSPGSSGVYTTRTMKKGASSLNYNLYSTAARTGNPWGNGTGNTTRYGPILVVLGMAATVTVYGRLPALQNVASGSYSDTIIATITF
jgi:spore coat protein U-like protein